MNVTYIVLAVQLWMIYEILSFKAQVKLRIGFIEGQLESEKETRKRRNEGLDDRLRKLEQKHDARS